MSTLRAIVQTYVENMNEPDIAAVQKRLSTTECSFCGEQTCHHPVHAVLDELAVELLEEETEKRKDWQVEQPAETVE